VSLAAARHALDSGWEIAREGDAGWRAVSAPLPVAALLAEAGEWSLDAPAPAWHARVGAINASAWATASLARPA
jgi:hypothetical protein